MLFIEIGNSTIKVARRSPSGSFATERFGDADELERRMRNETGSAVVAPVAGGRAAAILSSLSRLDNLSLQVLERSRFADFIGDSYDTPETLGLDRVLNLLPLRRDGLVISCGTAITVDAVAGGRPFWGAIMPGFRTAAVGLSAAAPALPTVSFKDLGALPARTSHQSAANGVILGTALAAAGLAALLAERCALPDDAPLLLTGGDADLLHHLLPMLQIRRPAELRPALLFEGMEAAGSSP